jgi:hypothetical protein
MGRWKNYKWSNVPKGLNVEAGHVRPPNEDEQNGAPFYAAKLEAMLTEHGLTELELGSLLYDFAIESGVEGWQQRSHAQRSVRRLLNGQCTLTWVMNVIDAFETWLKED